MTGWNAHSDLEEAQIVCPRCGGDGGWGPERPGQTWLEGRQGLGCYQPGDPRMAKIDAEMAADIKAELSASPAVSYGAIARKLGVTPKIVRDIAVDRTWRHVPMADVDPPWSGPTQAPEHRGYLFACELWDGSVSLWFDPDQRHFCQTLGRAKAHRVKTPYQWCGRLWRIRWLTPVGPEAP